MELVLPHAGSLGMALKCVDGAFRVVHVAAGSAAAAGGVRKGDVVLRFRGAAGAVVDVGVFAGSVSNLARALLSAPRPLVVCVARREASSWWNPAVGPIEGCVNAEGSAEGAPLQGGGIPREEALPTEASLPAPSLPLSPPPLPPPPPPPPLRLEHPALVEMVSPPLHLRPTAPIEMAPPSPAETSPPLRLTRPRPTAARQPARPLHPAPAHPAPLELAPPAEASPPLHLACPRPTAPMEMAPSVKASSPLFLARPRPTAARQPARPLHPAPLLYLAAEVRALPAPPPEPPASAEAPPPLPAGLAALRAAVAGLPVFFTSRQREPPGLLEQPPQLPRADAGAPTPPGALPLFAAALAARAARRAGAAREAYRYNTLKSR